MRENLLKTCVFGLVAGVVGGFWGISSAVTSTGASLNLYATVPALVTLSIDNTSAGDNSINLQDPTVTQVFSSPAINVNFPQGMTATLTFGEGTNPNSGSSDTSPLRQLSDGQGNFLAYFILDKSNSAPLGFTPATGMTITGTGFNQAITVNIAIPPQGLKPPGKYTDNIIVQISY